ncbi:hypothetical protein DQ04_02091070 [Trypanosoma grayi]|uniref:hypothetical protein n=1 Tax=Trypanosoma grayi TaxID=71804 RepID=UPI0004F41C07|nr:hypothetical protein DQ04_02091070 [Trypanosoma grayi]KEG11994.1 hypothetical protein DQ04_02091070 [Trypanosoma grayi]
MQGCSVTRRVRVAGVEPEDITLRVELFRTFAAYGAVEEVCFEEDRAFHSGAAIIQFQRLSAAERFQNDMTATGRRWAISFLPPVVHVGSELLVTSPKAVDTAFLHSLLAGGEPVVMIEEKIVSVPSALNGDATADAEGFAGASDRASNAKDDDVRGTFLTALACVRARAIGRFAALMSFKTVYDANSFLTTHQISLAATKDMYVTHVGSNEVLQRALKHVLLTRRSVKNVAKGLVLRGIVLPQSNKSSGNSMMYCEVDAGLTRKGHPIILRTQTNFVKVFPWDVIEARLTSTDVADNKNFLEAELRGVVSTRKGSSVEQKPSVILNRLRHLGGGSNTTTAANVAAAATAPKNGKALAGRLYQALQERSMRSDRAGESQLSAAAVERVHRFPQGIHLLSVVPVCIQRIENDGLYARTVPALPAAAMTSVSSQEWPVFVPSMFVPRQGGMEWRDFAVPGERMTVAVLYATAVGGSEASLRLVASKRETEMRRASALMPATPTDAKNEVDGTDTTETSLVGMAFSGSCVVWLPSTPSTDGPVYVVLPSSSAPPVLFTISIFLHTKGTAVEKSPDAAAVDVGLHSFVVSELVHDSRRGRYAVVVEEPEYRQMEAERRAAQEQRESEQNEFVRRILAETLGGDAVPTGGEESESGRKRPRSPQSG